MALLLIDPDCDLLIALDATSGLLDSLKEQWSRLQHDPERESFGTRLSGRILPILADCLDWDLKPPTNAQISFAVSIAKKLQLEIPAGVLQRRSDMAEFLDMHCPLLLARPQSRRRSTSRQRSGG
ncbi:hypothetical protein [Xanthomonas hortorum]|uniref:Uncharacterized protein n=1 Tax=Xanthomonas hortorum TaxID=56454 RepID=A0AA47END6_9XANT|nr:hypothetical protein [Xanthomonas hortorum]WAH62347.1 hypothetical protein OEG85_12415 [Xanthomonas hortorum]